jgi:Protein of unknown function (DUF1302)
MKKTVIILLIIMAAVSMAGAQDLEISGMLRSQLAMGVESGDFHEIKETLKMDLEYWGDMGFLHVSPYLNVNPLTLAGDQTEWGIREAYIDLYGEFLDLRIGKQAVFWGQAEGAFITDIVSPQNLSSFILADFEEIRLGIPAIKVTAYAGPLTLEAIWVQKFIPSILPGTDSVWRTSLMPNLSGAALPEATLKNSEIFVRASFFGSRLTFELVGGYNWDDHPVAEGSPSAPNLVYHRSILTGGILSTTLGSLGIRAEGSVTLDKTFSLLQLGAPPVLITQKHHFIQGLIGVDGNFEEYSLSAQYLLQYITDFDSALVNQKEMVHTATLRIQRKFLDERLTATLFGYAGFEPLNSLIRPEVSYWIEDGLKVSAGADIFLGEEGGRFGMYTDKSQITTSLHWYF